MTDVIGRFAPSPTGPLHFGSVVTAVASYLDVKARGGRWLLRIDDLDAPRIERGATASILATLEALALTWDGPIVYQSTRGAAYADALADLEARQLIYRCRCSRKTIGPRAYPGTCRAKRLGGDGACLAWRVRVGDEPIVVHDLVQGDYAQTLAGYCGDFVVRRADGIYAYHLAAVVDDAWSGVTEVTRGSDLLDSTPRQVHLQRLLRLPTPRYAHLPVVLDAQGDKLSKQTHAPAVTPANAADALYHALAFLGFMPPRESLAAAAEELLEWALPRWRLAAVHREARAYAWTA